MGTQPGPEIIYDDYATDDPVVPIKADFTYDVTMTFESGSGNYRNVVTVNGAYNYISNWINMNGQAGNLMNYNDTSTHQATYSGNQILSYGANAFQLIHRNNVAKYTIVEYPD